MARRSTTTSAKRSPTPEEERAIDTIARTLCPDEWAEYDAGHGTVANMTGWELLDSIKHAKQLIRRFPGMVELVNKDNPG